MNPVRVYYLCAGSSSDLGTKSSPQSNGQGRGGLELMFPQDLPEDLYLPGMLVLPRSKKYRGTGRAIYIKSLLLGEEDAVYFDLELVSHPDSTHRFFVSRGMRGTDDLRELEFSASPLRNFSVTGAAAGLEQLGPDHSLWVLQPRSRTVFERFAFELGLVLMGTSGRDETGGDPVFPPPKILDARLAALSISKNRPTRGQS